MRSVTTALVAVAAIAGLTGLALAAGARVHETIVEGPGGAVAHVRYIGNTAPRVIFMQGPISPFAVGAWAEPSPFAEIDRMTALMDRHMAQLIYQAHLLQEQASTDPLRAAVMKDMPAGTASYTFISTMSGNGICSRTMQITSSPNGGQPEVVSHTSGNCGGRTDGVAQSQSSQPASTLQTISYKSSHGAAEPRRGI